MEAEANSRDAAAVVPILDELAAARLRKLVLLQGCAGGCAPAARRGSLQRAPKIQASGKLRIELLYEPINH